MAERAGFEPAIPQRDIPVFETGAFNHSATSPQGMRRNAVHAGPRRTLVVRRAGCVLVLRWQGLLYHFGAFGAVGDCRHSNALLRQQPDAAA